MGYERDARNLNPVPYTAECMGHKVHNDQNEELAMFGATHNHTVERMWPEINNKVSYPLKTALVELVDHGILDMEDNLARHKTCQFDLELIIALGKGTPNILAEDGYLKKISEELLPHANKAGDLYEAELGSSLTRRSTFGTDPFSSGRQRACVECHFAELNPDISVTPIV
ncbi:hypothetical protein Z043_119192 [Scleropages formosus]|uniref:Uncharacterized protein n=1 Tax=Scleropages formosus TaxID=113540 RepID=A0A0P7ULE6_SCLFO|nr:hypothetical protein Z043_119192 [Scleropages formosus]